MSEKNLKKLVAIGVAVSAGVIGLYLYWQRRKEKSDEDDVEEPLGVPPPSKETKNVDPVSEPEILAKKNVVNTFAATPTSPSPTLVKEFNAAVNASSLGAPNKLGISEETDFDRSAIVVEKRIPKDHISGIIGKRGEHIKSLQSSSNTSITFKDECKLYCFLIKRALYLVIPLYIMVWL